MYKRIKRAAITAAVLILLALSSLVLALRLNYTPAVLMYHSVAPGADPSSRLAVSPVTFDRQMRMLKTRGFNVIPAEEFARNIKEGKRMPLHTVAITFDDGYKDNYIHAFPILRKYGLPATVFVITGEAGRQDRLSWDEIREMRDSGLIDFGSHTISHCILPEVASSQELAVELSGSKAALEKHLGGPVKMFAYPCGFFDERIKEAVRKAGYEFSFATNPRRKTADDDLVALKRIRISQHSGSSFAFWFRASGYYNFIRERRHR